MSTKSLTNCYSHIYRGMFTLFLVCFFHIIGGGGGGSCLTSLETCTSEWTNLSNLCFKVKTAEFESFYAILVTGNVYINLLMLLSHCYSYYVYFIRNAKWQCA